MRIALSWKNAPLRWFRANQSPAPCIWMQHMSSLLALTLTGAQSVNPNVDRSCHGFTPQLLLPRALILFSLGITFSHIFPCQVSFVYWIILLRSLHRTCETHISKVSPRQTLRLQKRQHFLNLKYPVNPLCPISLPCQPLWTVFKWENGNGSNNRSLALVESRGRPALRLNWLSTSSVLARDSVVLYRLHGTRGCNGGLRSTITVHLIIPIPTGRVVSSLVIIWRNIRNRSWSESDSRLLFSPLMIINQLTLRCH